MANASDAPPNLKPRWYAPTPAKFLLAVLVMQGVLFLSARYHWFWFNERKGYTVLITVAATAIALLLLFAVMLVSGFFKLKAQFGLSTLLLIIPVVAISVGWLAREMDLSRQQRDVMELSRSPMFDMMMRQQLRLGPRQRPTRFEAGCREIEDRLRPLLGADFFKEIKELTVSKPEALKRIHMLTDLTSLTCESNLEVNLAHLSGLNRLRRLELKNCRIVGSGLESLTPLEQLKHLGLGGTTVTNADLDHLKGLAQLEVLDLSLTPITDEGLEHLKGFYQLQAIELKGTQVTAEGVAKLQSALPDCLIVY